MKICRLPDILSHCWKFVLRILEPDGLNMGKPVRCMYGACSFDKMQQNRGILASIERKCKLTGFKNIKQSVNLLQSMPNFLGSICIMRATHCNFFKQRPILVFTHPDVSCCLRSAPKPFRLVHSIFIEMNNASAR